MSDTQQVIESEKDAFGLNAIDGGAALSKEMMRSYREMVDDFSEALTDQFDCFARSMNDYAKSLGLTAFEASLCFQQFAQDLEKKRSNIRFTSPADFARMAKKAKGKG